MATLSNESIENESPADPAHDHDSVAEKCRVCYEPDFERMHWGGLSMPCDCPVCAHCLAAWCTVKVEARVVSIYCPLQGCGQKVPEDLLLAMLDREHWAKYQQHKTDISHFPHIKTCPNCGAVTFKPVSTNVTCAQCQAEWCFPCHSPLHTPLTCAEFQGRDRGFQKWNARHSSWCPMCKAPIQKIEGCNHINCSVCNCHYCYACGVQFANGELDPALHKCPKGRWHRRRRSFATASASVVVLSIGLAVGVPLCLAGGVVVGTGWGLYYSVAKPVELVSRLHQSRKAAKNKAK